MKLSKENKLKVAFYGAVGLVGLAVVAGITSLNDAVYPASEGREYLEQEGYTNIQGGDETSFLNACFGQHTMSRKYTVDDPDTGKAMEKTVCFGLFGPRGPLWGN